MLDIKLLRQDLTLVATQLARRGFVLDTARFNTLEDTRKVLQNKTQALQQERNNSAKMVGQAKARGEDVAPLLQQANQMGEALKKCENELALLQQEIEQFLLFLPNILDPSVPDGRDESNNQEISRTGTPRVFSFTPKDHTALGEGLKQMDFEGASKLSGSRFVVLNKGLARLHRALIQFMLDIHINEHGYQETYIPYLVKSHCFYGTGQLPKFAEDFFMLKGEQDLGLIPTAEVALTNLARDSIIANEEMPRQLVAHSPCFRSEAGSYGRDTRGMIRQHQFEKVELVHLARPEESAAAHERLTHHAEVILQKLELPYRKMLLCAGDTSFSAHKTYDLEVWLPGQNAYREISSCSNCGDFQARRMQARYRNPVTQKPELIHTLNGSGLAVGRTLVAVIENYQEADGSVTIPKILQPYQQESLCHYHNREQFHPWCHVFASSEQLYLERM